METQPNEEYVGVSCLCTARVRAAAPKGARLINRDECTCEPKARVHEERSF